MTLAQIASERLESRKRAIGLIILCFLVFLPGKSFAQGDDDILIGLTAEFGLKTSTSAQAIEMGILTAIDEINARGGVLGGRKIGLIIHDNRSVPARAVSGLRMMADNENVVAVFGGKFSPVVLEMKNEAEKLDIPLLDPWAAADNIISIPSNGSYVFRLSMKDSWALASMVEYANQKGWSQLGLLVPNNAWGRSSKAAAARAVDGQAGISIVSESWYNWGDASLFNLYGAMIASGVDAVLMVANEGEGAQFVQAAASHPENVRVPLISHWGISGGDFAALTGESLHQVDLSVVQTFTFANRSDDRAVDVLNRAGQLFELTGPADIPSQVGFAHAYDLTHILALSIEIAGSTSRSAIRTALEQVENYSGLVRHFDRPFSASLHEALRSSDVFIGRFLENGMIVEIDP